jgi:hypothetical protein
MNLDKSTKRIAKRVKKGFQGYPQISIEYLSETNDVATELVVGFTLEDGAEVQQERFVSTSDARKDETIQTTLLKIIERTDAKTVIEVEGTSIK